MPIGTFKGTLTPDGYTAPAGTQVTWWSQTAGTTTKRKPLNPGVPILNHRDLIGRYGGNDQSLVGWQTFPAVSSEHSGGEAFGVVAKLFEVNGVGREPTDAEWVDFAFANFPDLLKVEIKDARRVLSDYRADEDGGGSGTDDAAAQARIRDLEAKNAQLIRDNATLTARVTELAARVRLVLPTNIVATLKELPTWEDIPRKGGRLRRINAMIRWLSGEVARRDREAGA